MDDLFKSLGIDRVNGWRILSVEIVYQFHFWLVCISERESRIEEGLNTKVKLDIYKRFGKSIADRAHVQYLYCHTHSIGWFV